MHLLFLLSLAFFLVSVSGFTVPKGQANGVYLVEYHDNGTETHSLLRLYHGKANAVPARKDHVGSAAGQAKAKRQVSNSDNYVGCGGYYLDAGDTNSANAELDAQCGDGAYVPANADFYSVVGCTVAYFCNYSHISKYAQQTQCWAADRQAAAGPINSICGGYGAGWDQFVSRIDIYGGQYGWESICGAGSNFCGRGTGR